MSTEYTRKAFRDREEIILELASIAALMAVELVVAGVITPTTKRLVTQAKEAAIRAGELCPELREPLGFVAAHS